MSLLHYNRYPQQMGRELEAARRAGVVPVEIPSSAFDILAASGVRMIFVVMTEGGLLAAPRQQQRENISHAVLADGGPVLAAGEFSLDFVGTTMVVSALNDMSGHYQPGKEALSVARTAFEAAGISVQPDAAKSYDWEAP